MSQVVDAVAQKMSLATASFAAVLLLRLILLPVVVVTDHIDPYLPGTVVMVRHNEKMEKITLVGTLCSIHQ